MTTMTLSRLSSRRLTLQQVGNGWESFSSLTGFHDPSGSTKSFSKVDGSKRWHSSVKNRSFCLQQQQQNVQSWRTTNRFLSSSSSTSNIKVTKTRVAGAKQKQKQKSSAKAILSSHQRQEEQGSSSSSNNTNNNSITSILQQNPEQEYRGKNKKKEMSLPDSDKEREMQILQQRIQQHWHYKQTTGEAWDDCQKLLDRCLDHFEGKHHPATASAYNNLALFAKHNGDWETSRKHYIEALRIYGEMLGKDHASYAAALHNLSMLYVAQVEFNGDDGDDENNNNKMKLTQSERLGLLDQAIEYLQEAWQIRQAELGQHHVYTITSQSCLGSALALQFQILQQPFPRESDKKKNRHSWTRKQWDLAESHLRQAYEQAKSLKPSSINETKNNTNKVAAPRLSTLTAASAAQNLAIFLKTKGTEIVHNVNDNNNNNEDDASSTIRVVNQEAIDEARQLYQDALEIRLELLPDPAHTDILTTKYSLSQLLEATGDQEAANALREEIMKDYGVQEVDDNDPTTSREEKQE